MTVAGALLAGLVAAVVTRRLHRRATGWGARIGRSRFRYANLPVGGALLVAGGAALGSPALISAGVAMGIVAVAWRWVDPLQEAWSTSLRATHIHPLYGPVKVDGWTYGQDTADHDVRVVTVPVGEVHNASLDVLTPVRR